MLLGLVLLGGLGVVASGWRRAYPDVAERVERFDVAEPTTPSASVTPASGISTARAPSRTASTGALATTAPPPPSRPSKVTAADGPFDLNRATRADLQRLPGVGPALAERIISARDEAGPFISVDDLRRIPGIGVAKIERLRPFLIVSD
jgi:competence protein ComEA